MASTRDRALDAALALVGEQGIRALTHARVDERAGLPKGSTSNWFRTREALVAGVVAWLAETERAEFASGDATPVETPEQLIEALADVIAVQTGPLAPRTRARYALFLEGAGNPELLAPLLAQRRAYVEWTLGILARVGARHPEQAVRTLMAAGDGIVLHRVTVDPDAEIRPVVERAVRACLD
ncbi:TetR family transcriptional regulator [Microbacterium sp. BK668]|uniref:TetR/AcrR family transcriptional regulator n=1 Tax=Microbacterium sp. BK668 TaxID=2512118 RepID=UPI00105BF9EE|nr:TetR family transcriptional regulator [Microbacterium sp. BK668]TDN92189.1 TetR family transcriptional regulator [Microbacterium sp. BK668]